MHDLRPCALDVSPTNQLMHGWTCCIDRVKNYKVAIAVTAAFETDDSDRMTRSLEIYRWQQGLVHARTIVHRSLGKIAFDGKKE